MTVTEGNKSRVQPYEGLIIGIHRAGVASTITVRKSLQGFGVERIFPIHSPLCSFEEVRGAGKPIARRSKLYYLRERVGKNAKLKSRFVAKKEGLSRWQVKQNALIAEKEAAAAVAKGLVPPPTAASVGGAGLASPEPAPQLGIAAGASRNAPNPDEPKYCVCNRVSFGEMIACENEACAVEWFHFACVGLSTDAKIKGKWYCNACAAERRRLKKLEAKAAGDKAK